MRAWASTGAIDAFKVALTRVRDPIRFLTSCRAGLLVALLVVGSASAAVAASARLRPVASLYGDSKGKPLERPEGVGCDAKSVVVADTGNGRLVVYSRAGDTPSPTLEIVQPQIGYPIRVRIDSQGDILVLDGKLRRIARMSAGGEFKGYVEPAGDAETVALVVRSFALDAGDTIDVLDVRSGRVLVLDSAGKLLRQISIPASCRFPSDVAADGHGTILVLDSVGRKVFTAKKDEPAFAPLPGTLQEDLDFPTAMAADGAGRVYISDQNGSGIVILGQDGSFQGRQSGMGWRPGQLRYPSQLCLDGRGTLFVADRENKRVQIFSVER